MGVGVGRVGWRRALRRAGILLELGQERGDSVRLAGSDGGKPHALLHLLHLGGGQRQRGKVERRAQPGICMR